MNESQINSWVLRHAYFMLVIFVLGIVTERIELLSIGAIISFSFFIYSGRKSLMKLKPPGGYPNWVTGTRLLLIIVGSFLFAFTPKLIILLIMSSAVVLDFFDGFLARKYNQATFFGHSFDVEVDSFFVLLMCFYYFQLEGIPWWILIPGLMRYLYLVFTSIFPKPNFTESKNRYASAIAGIFFVILCGGIILEGGILQMSLLVGAALIIFSFGISSVRYIRFKE